MNKQQLREQLEQLYVELRQTESDDDKEQELLDRLARDIRAILEDENHDEEQLKGLRGRLRDAVASFEASHPKATLFMRELIDQLSVLGI